MRLSFDEMVLKWPLLFFLAACESARPAPPPAPVRLSAAERARATQQIDSARAASDAQDRQRRAALKGAPQDGRGSCPVAAASLVDATESIQSARLRLQVLKMTDPIFPARPLANPGPARAAMDDALADVAASLDRGIYPPDTASALLERIQTKIDAQAKGYDLTLVAERVSRPDLVGEDRFVSGELEGRLYLWSRTERRHICVAPLRGESSESVTVRGIFDRPTEGEKTGRLFGDLMVSSIVGALHEMTNLPKKR